MATEEIIVDELLCFISNKIDKVSPDTILRLCIPVYKDGQIEKSKKILFSLPAAAKTKRRLIKRVGDDKDSKNLEDIVNLLQELGTNIPKFVAADLSKLPPITFNNIDVTVLLNRINQVEEETKALREVIGSQNQALRNLQVISASTVEQLAKQKIVDHSTSPVPLQRTEEPSAGSERKPEERTAEKEPCLPAENDATAENNNNSKAAVDNTVSADGGTSEVIVSEITPNDADKTNMSPSEPEKTPDTYAEVTGRKPKNFPMKKTNAKERSPPFCIIGRSEAGELKVVPRKKFASVFATRFAPEVTPEEMKTFLQCKTNLKVAVEKLSARHTTYSSFHITCECDNPSLLVSESLWPQGCYVRWWRKSNKPSASKQDANNNKRL